MDNVKKALSNDFRMIENWFHEKVTLLNAKQYYYTLRESIEVLDGKKQKLDCIFEQ